MDFVGFGVWEWSKNAPGTRTIIFSVTQSWLSRRSPISCISGGERLCISGRQGLLFFSTKRISVCLRNREYCSSATRKSSPNPSYLHSGEFVLVWDTKNRSRHTQIVQIEILRAQMFLKSAETEGTPPSEHMDIFAKNKLLALRGVWEAQCVKTIVFFQPKWRERPFRVDETTASVTKSAACA